MSRVQKKPIRRKLKDPASKTEEPNMPETAEINNYDDAPIEVPTAAERPKKASIPRKPKPDIVPKSEGEKPVKKVRRINDEETESIEKEKMPRRVGRPVASGRDDAAGDKEERSGGNRNDRTGDREERSSGRNDRNGDREERSSGRNDRIGGRDERGGRNDRSGGRNDRNGGRGERGGARGDRNGGRGPRDGKRGGEKKKRPEKIVYEKTTQFVYPGEAVGAIEEYKPGFGTVNDDGTIRSTVMGVVGINKEHRMITIIPKTKTLNTITEGDIVIVSVTDVRESNARVDLVAAEKSLDEEIVNKGNAEIYVSNIKDGFAKSVADEFCINDIVRAKVIDSSKIGLSTVDGDLGVLKAYCSKCKTPLTRSGDILVCGNCGNQERRKLAAGYGKGIAPMP
jgi:Predicted RNA-binding protein (consists of S1 domain and a Zn-ribbon domain)